MLLEGKTIRLAAFLVIWISKETWILPTDLAWFARNSSASYNYRHWRTLFCRLIINISLCLVFSALSSDEIMLLLIYFPPLFFWCHPSNTHSRIVEISRSNFIFSTVTFSLRSLELDCCCLASSYSFCLARFVLLHSWFFESNSYTRENNKQHWELFKHLASLSCLLLWVLNNLALHLPLFSLYDSWTITLKIIFNAKLFCWRM